MLVHTVMFPNRYIVEQKKLNFGTTLVHSSVLDFFFSFLFFLIADQQK